VFGVKKLRYIQRVTSEALSPGSAALPAHSLRPQRILVADDNRDIVLTLQCLLQEERHDVVTAHNGLDALRIARLHAFDVIILDIEMPEVSGYALARELRAQYYPKRGPLLIAITGKWNKPSEKLLAQAVGFDHHLSKPCDPKLLLKLVSAHRLSAIGAG
jgi:CheY-like chemotaxis protein